MDTPAAAVALFTACATLEMETDPCSSWALAATARVERARRLWPVALAGTALETLPSWKEAVVFMLGVCEGVGESRFYPDRPN